jgi:hypothetical protein
MEKLKDYYLGENLEITPCVIFDDSSVEFSFVEGTRYDKKFSNIMKSDDLTEMQAELERLRDVVYEVKTTTSFRITEEFKSVFGNNDYDILKGKKAYTISNIDMIFANMIIKDDKIYVTDYEWVFDFPVPIDYILYRSLMLNIDYSMLDDNDKHQLLSFLNITEADKHCYEKMEERFQQYVSGKNVFSEYKKNSSKRVVRLNDISTKAYPNAVRLVCEDINGAIISSQSIQYKDVFEIKQEITSDIRNIRIQFEVQGAIYKVRECYGICNNGEHVPLPVESNASFAVNNDYYFDNNSPTFQFKNDDYKLFCVNVLVYYENSSVVGHYIKKILECEEKTQQLSTAENRIVQLKAEIDGVKNTKIWKFYSKLKRLLRH